MKNQTVTAPIALDLEGIVAALGGNLSVELVRLEIKRGNLKASRFGRRVLMSVRELERYLAENTASVAE